MTALDFITELFCRVDDAMKGVKKHSQAKLLAMVTNAHFPCAAERAENAEIDDLRSQRFSAQRQEVRLLDMLGGNRRAEWEKNGQESRVLTPPPNIRNSALAPLTWSR
jgi:hypothetical protein